VVLCVQAGRKVDEYEEKIPGASDCQWASDIEQTCDKLLGIWRPVLTEDPDQDIKVNGQVYKPTQGLLIAKLLKQRMAPAGQKFVLNFAPEWVSLMDVESSGAGRDPGLAW
jgi:hypothetical protein